MAGQHGSRLCSTPAQIRFEVAGEGLLSELGNWGTDALRLNIRQRRGSLEQKVRQYDQFQTCTCGWCPGRSRVGGHTKGETEGISNKIIIETAGKSV